VGRFAARVEDATATIALMAMAILPLLEIALRRARLSPKDAGGVRPRFFPPPWRRASRSAAALRRPATLQRCVLVL
jgi:hypothetical protein